jgi:hypothetical protein
MDKLRRLHLPITMRSTPDTQQQRRPLLLPGQCRPQLHLLRFAANPARTLLHPSSVLVATGFSVTIATDAHTSATMLLTNAFQLQQCTRIVSNARSHIHRLLPAMSVSYASGAVRAIDPSVRHAVRPAVRTILPHHQPTRARPWRLLQRRTSSDMSA